MPWLRHVLLDPGAGLHVLRETAGREDDPCEAVTRELIREPHTTWYRTAHCALPDPLPDIRLGPAPGYEDNPLSGYEVATRTIHLIRSDWHSRRTLGHETGHCFADTYLVTRELRNEAARRFTGHPARRWYWGNWNPLTHWQEPNEEPFADLYSQAFVGAVVPAGFRAFLARVSA